MSVALRLVAPEPSDLTLDDLAETIRTAFATSKRRSMEKAEADLTMGRALLEARSRFPSDRQFGQWFTAQRFGFSRQWSLSLREAAEREPEVRALLTSYLSEGREPSLARALQSLHETGPKACGKRSWHAHVRHPFGPDGWLCLIYDADPDERLAWADDIAATEAAYREAERRRPPGDGRLHDMGPVGTRRDPGPWSWFVGSAVGLRIELSWHVKSRDAMVALLASLPRDIAKEEEAIRQLRQDLDQVEALP